MGESLLQGRKILHVIGDSKFGGDTVYMFVLAEMAREEGAIVEVCSTTPETLVVAEKMGFYVRAIPRINREIHLWKDIKALFLMIRLCRQKQYDLVHTHTSKGGVVGRIGARIAGVPIVIHTIHGFSFHVESSWFQRRIYSTIERVAGYFCDLAISVNDEDRICAINDKILPKSKVITIKNGVDQKRFNKSFDRNQYRNTIGVSPNQVLVGTLSRFSEQKDPLTFIHAAEIITRTHSNVKFIFAGEGPMMEEMRKEISIRGLEENVILPGFLASPENCIRSLDIFVTTALYEGLPIALIEAMCVGLPIVATNVKGNRECVDENSALLVNAKDTASVANAIETLIKNKEISASLAKGAKEKFNNEFSQERMVHETKKVYYQKLISKFQK